MASFKLKTDAYRDGRYYRAGEVMVCTGDQKPPKGSIPVKDAAPEAQEAAPAEPTPTETKPAEGSKGKQQRPSDKSPVG